MEVWPQTQAGISVVVDDVISAAAVSRGSFYKHFASLEEALDAIGRLLADEMTIGLMPVYDMLSDPCNAPQRVSNCSSGERHLIPSGRALSRGATISSAILNYSRT